MVLTVCLAFSAAAFAIVLAGLVLRRNEPSLTRNVLAIGLALLGIDSLFVALSCLPVSADRVVFWQCARFFPFTIVPGTWLLFALTYSRGAFRDHARRWRPALVLSLVVPPVLALLSVRHLALAVTRSIDSESWFVIYGPMARALHGVFIVVAVLVLMNLERTLRSTTGTMRWRVKYMIAGVGLLFCMRIYSSTQAVLYSGMGLSLFSIECAGQILCMLLILRAILRARLLQVDVYPSHAVLYHSVTVMVAGLYLLAVGLLAKLVTMFGLSEGFPVKAFVLMLALIGLTILFLSDRVRQEIRRLVGRHFARPQYDYRKVWQAFASQSARAMESDTLCRSLVRMLSETFDVLGVTIWLIDGAEELLLPGGSTSLVDSQLRDILDGEGDHAASIALMRRLPAIVDIDAGESDVNQGLRRLVPVEFGKKGGHRICVPLRAGQELLGVAMLSDRVRGLPFTTEELDLLVTIGEEISANLLKIRLSAKVLAAKEREAFQTMSAFIVHDLKNTSSTLSLTLQNLPRHFDDPEFRADALNALSRSVNRINELIGGLTVLRSGLTIEAQDADLNQIVRDAVAALDADRRERVTVATQALKTVSCDVRHMQAVVTNLLLNALDAGGDNGRVWVTTQAEEGRVRLSVRDDGQGMSQEFMRQSLFRPFRSTKKNGMGIGLFQSKTIVEAHGGRIDVQSTEGEGSTFSILLGVKEDI